MHKICKSKFSKVELLDFCKNQGWDVVCRTAKNRRIRFENREEKITLGVYLYPNEGAQTTWIPNVLYTHKKYAPKQINQGN